MQAPDDRRSLSGPQRTKELVEKRAQGAIACAECRRLKLKCSKEIPCSSCRRRGCESICPNGTLVSGQGTRMLLADTEQLHAQIATMSERIRNLEENVASQQSKVSTEPHALLRSDLLKIKSTLELHAAVKTPPEEGASQPVTTGKLASEDAVTQPADNQAALATGQTSSYTDGLSSLSGALGASGSSSAPVIHRSVSLGMLRQTPARPPVLSPYRRLAAQLPLWPHVRDLSRVYLEFEDWMLGFVGRQQLMVDILPNFYTEAAPQPDSTIMSPIGSVEPTADGNNPHLLALLFAVLSVAAMLDPARDMPARLSQGERWYDLSRDALDLKPVLDQPPCLETVQTLAILGFAAGMLGGPSAGNRMWSHYGLSGKLAQSVELHRDPSRQNLPVRECQKRRSFFWTWQLKECWICLGTDRIPTFSLNTLECQLPADDGTLEGSFAAWSHRFARDCLTDVACSVTTQKPKLDKIMELDRAMRAVDLPRCSGGPVPYNSGMSAIMRHYIPLCFREFAILYLHRTFFALAIRDSPLNPHAHNLYGTSFLATFRSACTSLDLLKDQLDLLPVDLPRVFWLWHRFFSAAVIVGSVAMLGPKVLIAPSAFKELEQACATFKRAQPYGGLAALFFPELERMYSKASNIFTSGSAEGTGAIPSAWQMREYPGHSVKQMHRAIARPIDPDDGAYSDDGGAPAKRVAKEEEEDPDVREVWQRFLDELQITPKPKLYTNAS